MSVGAAAQASPQTPAEQTELMIEEPNALERSMIRKLLRILSFVESAHAAPQLTADERVGSEQTLCLTRKLICWAGRRCFPSQCTELVSQKQLQYQGLWQKHLSLG